MTRPEDEGICQRPTYRPEVGRITFWDGSAPGETWRDMRKRQATGIYLCGVCPALAACRRFLADMDERKQLVDGVVAGEARMWRRQY
ncbi:hypothetical protein CH253_19830 [Rhodococcus sp. 06-156-3C]|uniref:hypothetical protein n=1 Tax=Nocardiaceae TaxID=85025 RepID=UPI000522FEE8|nr:MULTISPECIES: hypothetical protein [Rhodococcus]OZD07688.1 hypothetical protein CH280_25465 [Rhodococcus sp. 06-156-4C]OZD17100.1 hypothetical protein CH253_19830 [Rhodococcus sp. 06-156-3C]OZD18438.1 hypothetical protein CH248_16650 [Rhodococcus sp. 06-156-4a]OZD28361.1 hypothetical protein CH284_29015 [Rhodococcus sp. 06-156-3]OZD29870.1 hypothetical protein CH247_15835 [Rhodococcus sp. 06-156-3b]